MASGAVVNLVAPPPTTSSNVTASMAQHAISASATLALSAVCRSAEGDIPYIGVNLASQMYLFRIWKVFELSEKLY